MITDQSPVIIRLQTASWRIKIMKSGHIWLQQTSARQAVFAGLKWEGLHLAAARRSSQAWPKITPLTEWKDLGLDPSPVVPNNQRSQW